MIGGEGGEGKGGEGKGGERGVGEGEVQDIRQSIFLYPLIYISPFRAWNRLSVLMNSNFISWKKCLC